VTRVRFVAALNPYVHGLRKSDAGREISFIPLESVWGDDRFDPARTIEFSGDLQSYNPVAEGDILVPKVSPTFAHGRAAIAKRLVGGRALATSEVFVLRAHDPDAAPFLRYRFLARDFLSEGQAAWYGVAGLKRISADFVLDVRIDEAAWRNRTLIAAFLDRECVRIDELLRACRGMRRTLSEAALARFVTLTGDLPLVRLGHHYEVQLGKMLDEGKVGRGEPVPYLRNQNVGWDRFDLSDVKQMPLLASERSRYLVRAGDLLACEGRHVGKCAIWDGSLDPMYYQKALHRIRPRADWSNRYLLWCLWLGNSRGDYFADGTGSTIPHLPAEKLRAVRIPAASRKRQDQIVRDVDAVHLRGEAVRDEISALELSLAEYRDALITEAVTGMLDVSTLSDAPMKGPAAGCDGAPSAVLA
jgi:type I restriction enzyme, S subunit